VAARAGLEVRRRHLEHVAITVKKEPKPGQRGHADGKGREQNQAQKRNDQKPCRSSLPIHHEGLGGGRLGFCDRNQIKSDVRWMKSWSRRGVARLG
jgi:hypothetical protein